MTAGQGLSKYKMDQRSDKVLHKEMHKVLQGAQGALQGDAQRVLLKNTRHTASFRLPCHRVLRKFLTLEISKLHPALILQ